MTNMPFVSVRGLNKFYTTGDKRLHVLRDLDLAVEQGEMLAIMGASGVGKSTLLHVLGGLDTIDAGEVRVGEHDIGSMDDEARVAFRNRHIGLRLPVPSSAAGVHGDRERDDAAAHRARLGVGCAPEGRSPR